MGVYDVNVISVFIAAIASTVIGIVWFSPALFGKAWMKLSGISTKDMEKAKQNMTSGYLGSFIAALVTAYVLGVFLNLTKTTNALDGAILGGWAAIGFVATTTLSKVLWEGKPLSLYLISNAHVFIAFIVMGWILAS